MDLPTALTVIAELVALAAMACGLKLLLWLGRKKPEG